MPTAAAPIISSVQKLVLYETRAVSTWRRGAGRRMEVWGVLGRGSPRSPDPWQTALEEAGRLRRAKCLQVQIFPVWTLDWDVWEIGASGTSGAVDEAP